MPNVVESTLFLNPSLGETVRTTNLVDNIGDIVEVEIKVRVEDYVLATTETEGGDGSLISLVILPPASLTGVIEDARHLYTSNPSGFETFKEGDEVTVINEGFLTYVKIIKEKVNSQLLLMDSAFGTGGALKLDSVAFVSTEIKSVVFSHNLILNNASPHYKDLTTGITRKAVAQGLSNTNTTPTEMLELGDAAYKFGILNISGNNIGDGAPNPQVSQAFTITQKFIVSPLFIANDENDIKNLVPPEILRDNNTLKHVWKAELSNRLNDPNDIKTVFSGVSLGNVGWFNENLKTGIANYTVSDVVYKRTGGEVIDALELSTNEMTVEFSLNSATGTFDNGLTRIVIGHFFKPTPEDLYRLPEFADPNNPNEARNREYKSNFFFDRIECTLGLPATNPQNLGGEAQVIKECETVHVSNNKVNVVLTVKMGASTVTRLASTSARDYLLFASTCDHLKDREDSDKVNPIIDQNVYFTDLTDPTMVTMELGFYNHPMIEGDPVKASLQIMNNDDFVGNAIIALDREDDGLFERAGKEIKFSSIKKQIIMRRDNSTYFIVDEYKNTGLSSIPIIEDDMHGTIPEPNINESRGFASPVDDLRANIVFKRRSDLDSGGLFYYEVNFPCIARDDPQVSLPAANIQFYDRDAPENHHFGLNHQWGHYTAAGTGWTMKFRVELIVTKDGEPLIYEKEAALTTTDYTDGIEWNAELMKAFRTDGSGDLVTGNIMKSENTLMRGDADYVNIDIPTVNDLVFVMSIRDFETTDYKGLFMISTLHARSDNNPLIGLLAAATASLTNPSGVTFRIEAETVRGLVQEYNNPQFGVKIYDLRDDPGIPDGLETETGILILSETGVQVDVE